MPGQAPLIEDPASLPLLPLRDVVVFPYMSISLLVGRLPSVNAIVEVLAEPARAQADAADRAHLLGPDILPLFSRLGPYAQATLDERSFGQRKRALFECWAHEACFAPMQDHALHRALHDDRAGHWARRHAACRALCAGLG